MAENSFVTVYDANRSSLGKISLKRSTERNFIKMECAGPFPYEMWIKGTPTSYWYVCELSIVLMVLSRVELAVEKLKDKSEQIGVIRRSWGKAINVQTKDTETLGINRVLVIF